jgi:hypothetical protein
MDLTLIRTAYLHDATLGILQAGSVRLCTLEEPWRPNPHGPGGQRREGDLQESCVPDGTYELVPHSGTTKKNVWALVNPALGVYRWSHDIPDGQRWGRAVILIHSGNSVKDTEGCILVGRRHGYEMNQPWLYDSRAALEQLRGLLGIGRHTLTIRPIAATGELAA